MAAENGGWELAQLCVLLEEVKLVPELCRGCCPLPERSSQTCSRGLWNFLLLPKLSSNPNPT